MQLNSHAHALCLIDIFRGNIWTTKGPFHSHLTLSPSSGRDGIELHQFIINFGESRDTGSWGKGPMIKVEASPRLGSTTRNPTTLINSCKQKLTGWEKLYQWALGLSLIAEWTLNLGLGQWRKLNEGLVQPDWWIKQLTEWLSQLLCTFCPQLIQNSFYSKMECDAV